MTLTDHPAVAAYLARLDAVSTHLSSGRRAELRADLVEHLSEALPAGADDATVRAVLDRLGPPEEIVRAEEPDVGPAGPPPRRGLAHEALAVAFLTIGSFVPVVGWIVGAVLLWTSRRWTTGEKLLGTLVVPGGPFAVVIAAAPLTLVAAGTCSASADSLGRTASGCSGPGIPGIVGVGVLVLLLVLPFVVGAVLLRRAARRARA